MEPTQETSPQNGHFMLGEPSKSSMEVELMSVRGAQGFEGRWDHSGETAGTVIG
jgi:hypothetical protein